VVGINLSVAPTAMSPLLKTRAGKSQFGDEKPYKGFQTASTLGRPRARAEIGDLMRSRLRPSGYTSGVIYTGRWRASARVGGGSSSNFQSRYTRMAYPLFLQKLGMAWQQTDFWAGVDGCTWSLGVEEQFYF